MNADWYHLHSLHLSLENKLQYHCLNVCINSDTNLVAMATSLEESEKKLVRIEKNQANIFRLVKKNHENRSSRSWDSLAHVKKRRNSLKQNIIARSACMSSRLNKMWWITRIGLIMTTHIISNFVRILLRFLICTAIWRNKSSWIQNRSVRSELYDFCRKTLYNLSS